MLVYGMEGTGKSLAALDIASRVAPATMFVIDNDNAWDRMLEGQTIAGDSVQVREEYRWTGRTWESDDRWCVESGNVVVFHADGWVANTKAIERVKELADPDDWCCIDTATALWFDVSDHFVDQVFNQSKADYFLQARIAMEKAKDGDGPMLEGWKDYGIINPIYNEGVMGFLITPPCHLIVTAEEEQVKSVPQKGKDIELKEVRAMFGGQHAKPRGQKRLGHNVQTVLRLTRQASGGYVATTVKDRGGREKLEMVDVTDEGFGSWYLEEIAQWQEQIDTSSTPPSLTAKSDAGTPVAKKIVSKS